MRPVLRRGHVPAFLTWGVVPTALAVAGLARGPVRPVDVALAAFSAAWWGAGVGLLRGRPGAPWAALALTVLPLSLALAQTARRAAFIWRVGDLERADGYGSPLAFLLGMAVEQTVFVVPLTVLGILLWRAARRVAP
jgi:hypothetical protein